MKAKKIIIFIISAVMVAEPVLGISSAVSEAAVLSAPMSQKAVKPTAEFISEPKAKSGLVYTGEEISLLEQAGEARNGKMRYSIDGINYFSFDELPKVKDAKKDYTVYYKIIGDIGYGNSEVKTIKNIEVAPIAAEIEWTQETEFTYDEKEKTVTAFIKNKVPNDKAKLILSENKKMDAGIYYAEITGIDSTNYVLDNVPTADLKKTWEIKQRDITGAEVELDTALTYNGKEQTQEVLKVTADGVRLWSSQRIVSNNTGTEANTYELTITPKNKNFTGTAKASFQIAKRPVEINWKNSTNIVYDGEEHTVIPQAVNICGDDTIEFTTGGTVTATETGTYLAKVTAVSNANYTLDGGKRVETNWTISPKLLTVDSIETIENQVYSGEAIEPPITLNGAKGPLILDTDYMVSYENNINAGVATAKIKVLNKNYEGTLKKYFNIMQKPINKVINLTSPKRGYVPQMSIESDEYNATVSWSPDLAPNGTFAKDTAYTATITITPTPNYTVVGNGEDGYTVEDATSVKNTADSNVITVVFPQTTGSTGGSSGRKSSYTIKFETNGGSTITNKTVEENDKVKKPTNPKKDGYSFEGWYVDEDLTAEYDFNTKVTKNFTLYAKWTEEEVKEPGSEQKPVISEWENPYSDVRESDWFFESVKYASQKNLMKGITNTEFAPNLTITRGMFVTVLYRYAGEPEVNKGIPFADVSADSYYRDATVWAHQNGIISGVDETKFAPDENITREQIATILYRYAKITGYDVSVGEMSDISVYTDFDNVSEYGIEAVRYAVGSGLMKGKTDNTLNPKDFATRDETAEMFKRFIENR